jgi:hypothetical protein
MSKNSLVPAPNGKLIYGYVEGCTVGSVIIDEGPIFLKEGTGMFGQMHIWRRHGLDLQQAGYEAVESVPKYVADILLHNTPVSHEGLASWEESKLFAIRSVIGFAVLQPTQIEGYEIAYSVTTAYKRGRTGAKRVSRILECCTCRDAPCAC